MVAGLNYGEKLMLTLYRELYGVNYIGNTVEKCADGIVKEHLKAQKAAYLFSLCEIPLENYGYIWDRRGPFSLGVQELLLELDHKIEDVNKYYDEYDQGKEIVQNALLTAQQIERMHSLVDSTKAWVRRKDDTECHNCELLGSIAFLAKTVMPGCDFTVVNQELKRRKSCFQSTAMNKSAWRQLVSAGILVS